ncbi:response regulator transcription factor [Martelella sp. AMO21009]
MSSELGKCVLVVEDDKGVANLLRDALSDAGFKVLTAGSRESLKRVIAESAVDLITLDLNLGGEDGLDIAAEMRATSNIPIIMITGRTAPLERVKGLESGADDYIAKPFHVREVLIRVKSVLARYDRPASADHDAGAQDDLPFDDGCVLSFRHRAIECSNGRRIELTDTEFELLVLFLTNPGRILSRDDLWKTLRGHERDPLDRTLDGHIAHLRQKMDVAGKRSFLIRSVRGVGYVFTGECSSGGPWSALYRAEANSLTE